MLQDAEALEDRQAPGQTGRDSRGQQRQGRDSRGCRVQTVQTEDRQQPRQQQRTAQGRPRDSRGRQRTAGRGQQPRTAG